MKMVLTETVDNAIDLACKGDFRQAIETLGDHWPGVGVEPRRDGSSDIEFAKLLTACGILTVELGSWTSIPCQASAKDLLSKSVRLSENEACDVARYWLAIAYLRCGENNEALAITDSILGEKNAGAEIVFLAGAVRGLTLLNLGKVAESVEAFDSVMVFFSAVPPMSRGRFLLNRGMLDRSMGRLDEALACYEQAITVFRLAGSVRYQAAALNNIAVVYTKQGRLTEAHAVAKKALAVFEELGDLAHQAKVWDQIAQIYGLQENFEEMEQCASRAVEILSTGDHEGWLAEALITLGTALAHLGMERAKGTLARALAICNRLTDTKQGKFAIAAMWRMVQTGKNVRKAVDRELLPVEETVYREVLAANKGRITAAAEALDMHHQVLGKRIETRFPDLLPPKRKRHKSIIKKWD